MHIKKMLSILLILLLLTSCGQNAASSSIMIDDIPYIEQTQLINSEDEIGLIEAEPMALAKSPSIPDILKPVASGTHVKKNSQAIIDYSNTDDGYVMVKFTESTSKRLKSQVTGSSTTYTYNIEPKEWTTFPLSDGNGTYKVTVFENVSGNKYSTVLSASFSVKLKDEFAPFIRPNQYVDYADAKNTIKKAASLTSGLKEKDVLKKVQKIYNYVVKNLTYDTKKAKNVQSGYLPDLDSVLKKKKGICFDYAALMTGMLRSQGVPCKLVVGYAGSAYHAWISVYSKKTGWIDGAIYFDGTSWQRMDPTFISSGKNSKSIQKFVGNGKNYSAKYLY
ncbi:MAG: transglutaminase domain-containing protein [Firmicutes bacterium]|jgi:transglutaminase-like putative cysteine protease|nr:transglutaminase domain-containing protein [Bacillota bacterium]